MSRWTRISALNADGSRELLWEGEVGLAERALGDALIAAYEETERYIAEVWVPLVCYEPTLVCRNPGHTCRITGIE